MQRAAPLLDLRGAARRAGLRRLGFDLTTRPSEQVPFGLRLGASVALHGGSGEIVIDGPVMPFRKGYSAVLGDIGLVWFVSRRFFLGP